MQSKMMEDEVEQLVNSTKFVVLIFIIVIFFCYFSCFSSLLLFFSSSLLLFFSSSLLLFFSSSSYSIYPHNTRLNRTIAKDLARLVRRITLTTSSSSSPSHPSSPSSSSPSPSPSSSLAVPHKLTRDDLRSSILSADFEFLEVRFVYYYSKEDNNNEKQKNQNKNTTQNTKYKTQNHKNKTTKINPSHLTTPPILSLSFSSLSLSLSFLLLLFLFPPKSLGKSWHFPPSCLRMASKRSFESLYIGEE